MTTVTNLLRRKSTYNEKNQKRVSILGDHVRGMTDQSLEAEIKEIEADTVSERKLQRVRYQVGHYLHHQIALVFVAALCIMDCILVVGGLILELRVINNMYTHAEKSHSHVLKCVSPTASRNYTNTYEYKFYYKLGHALHYASIVILAVLLLETLVKIACVGKQFFKKKYEVFDAFVTAVSFIVDLVYLKGTINNNILKDAETLSFILPWRVIRVVNSLIVALLTHEHIKLLRMCNSKMYIQRQLDHTQEDLHIIQLQFVGVKELAISEGVSDSKIVQTIGRIFRETVCKREALKTMVSLSMASALANNERILTCITKKNSIMNSIQKNIYYRRNTTPLFTTQVFDVIQNDKFKRSQSFKDQTIRGGSPGITRNDVNNVSYMRDTFITRQHRYILSDQQNIKVLSLKHIRGSEMNNCASYDNQAFGNEGFESKSEIHKPVVIEENVTGTCSTNADKVNKHGHDEHNGDGTRGNISDTSSQHNGDDGNNVE